MHKKLLIRSIELIYQVREELSQGNTGDNIIERLDEVIYDLESIQINEKEYSSIDLLDILGRVIELVPTIINLLNRLK